MNTGGEKVYPAEVEQALLEHAEELAGHLDRRLAGHKKPRHVLLRGSLERSPQGKVDLARLKQEAAAELTPRVRNEQ